MIIKEYRLRRKSDGLYSSGGMSPRWSNKPKVWYKIGHIKNHIRQLIPPKYRLITDINNCRLEVKLFLEDLEIIETEIELTEKNSVVVPLNIDQVLNGGSL